MLQDNGQYIPDIKKVNSKLMPFVVRALKHESYQTNDCVFVDDTGLLASFINAPEIKVPELEI